VNLLWVEHSGLNEIKSSASDIKRRVARTMRRVRSNLKHVRTRLGYALESSEGSSTDSSFSTSDGSR
jgi:hypothetical protein